jgi:tetratricopeptide (TPR) repeat protein
MDNGERCLHHALKIQPNVRGAHTYEGILALKLGDLNQAEKEFQAELANDPNYQMAIAELGEVRYHQQRWSEAAELLAKSKTMTPELLYMLCDADFHLGKVDDADLNAEAMAAYARGNPQLMNGLFDLLNRNGQAHLAARLEENSAN